jgi:YVTN family beta-propeller protein
VFLRRLLASFLLSVAVTACRSTTETGPQPAHVVVSPDPVIVAQKGTALLSVSVTDKNDAVISGAVVTFTSANAQVVTVSDPGLVTSVGPAGSTTLTVKSGNASTAVPVTVTPVTSGIVVLPDPAAVYQKATLQLHAIVMDAVGRPIPDAPIMYAPSDASMLTVSPTGLIQSLGPAGNTTVILSSGPVSDTLSVVVSQVPSDLRVAPSPAQLDPHAQIQLTATVIDAIGGTIPSASVVWISSDPNIITVSSTGLVTSVGPVGIANVTVASGALTRTVPVRVGTITHPSATSVTTSVPFFAWGVGTCSTGVIIAPNENNGASVRVDPATGTLTSVNGNTSGSDVAFSPDCRTAYVANHGASRVDVIDVATNAVTSSVPTVVPYSVQVDRDNHRLFVGAGGFVSVYDLATRSEQVRILGAGQVNAITRYSSLDLLYASGDSMVTEIDGMTGVPTRQWRFDRLAQQSVVSQDGNTLYVALEGGDLAVIDLPSGTKQQPIVGAGGFGAALTPDGAELWVVIGTTLKIIDPVARTFRTFTLPGVGRRLVFSTDGSTAVITEEGTAIMFVR